MSRIVISIAVFSLLLSGCTAASNEPGEGTDTGSPSRSDAGSGPTGNTGDGSSDPGGNDDSGSGDTGSGGQVLEGSGCDGQAEDIGSDMSRSMTIDTAGERSDASPAHDCAPSCDGLDVPDKVLEYTPPVDGLLSVSTRDGFDAVISIFDDCSGAPRTLTCNHSMHRAAMHVTAGVPLYIVIDGCEDDDVGQVQMDLDLFPDEDGGGGSPGTDGGDTCASPPVLSFHDVGGGVLVATASGDTSGASNDFDPTDYFAGDHTAQCHSNGGPDHYYAIENQEPIFARIEVRPDDSSFDPLVYVFTDCVSSSMDARNPKACSYAAGGPGEMESFNTVLLEERTYFVGVDGVDGTSGAYELTVRLGE